MQRLQKYLHQYFEIIAIIIYLIFGLIKMRAYMGTGRFWAEEGSQFYRDMANQHSLDNIFYIFHGHLELVTNLIVYASTFVDLRSAPLITTYASFAVQLIPMYFIIRYRKALSLTHTGTLFVIIIAVGLPQAQEVWANSINLHFHFGLLAALIAAVNPDEGPPKWVSRLLLIIAGLSGIPANFLAPIFGLVALRTQETERKIQFLIIALTTVLQLILLATHHSETGQREYLSTPLAFWLAPVAQSVTSPLFGPDAGEQLAMILREALQLKSSRILFAIFFSVPLIYIFSIGINNNNSTRIIVASGAILLFMCIFSAIGDKKSLISAASHGRYFYASNVIFSIALFASHKNYKSLVSIFLFVLLASSLLNSNKYLAGPDWESNFEQTRDPANLKYDIWPTGWSMILKGR